MIDTGHSLDPEKKASGIKDMQPIVVASGIFVLHEWWKISTVQDSAVFQVVSPRDRGIQEEK